MSRRMPANLQFHVKRRWEQQLIMYPAKKYVLLNKDEKETITTAMLRFWVPVDKLVIATDHNEFAVAHQEIHAALADIRVELAYVQSAVMRATTGGHYRDTLSPQDPAVDEPPF